VRSWLDFLHRLNFSQKRKKRRSLISKTPALQALWYFVLGWCPFEYVKGRRSNWKNQQTDALIFVYKYL
jgi:hypothetical protein